MHSIICIILSTVYLFSTLTLIELCGLKYILKLWSSYIVILVIYLVFITTVLMSFMCWELFCETAIKV